MSSISAADADVLRSIGREAMQNTIALAVEAVLWTTYLILVYIASKILLRKGHSKMTVVTLAIVVVMFLMDTAIFIIDIRNTVKGISLTLTSNWDMPLQDRYALTASLPWQANAALYAFMSNLGDVIVTWRVYAFYSRGNERWVLVVPTALLVGSFITSGVLSYCVAQHFTSSQGGNFAEPFCKDIQLSSYCTTLATTGVSTCLISYKTWEYRRTIGRHLAKSRTVTKAERLMYILIESGILYFLFFLENVISDTGNIGELEYRTPGLALASTVWTFMTSHILGIYPVLIIILVHLERSFIERHSTPSSIPPRPDFVDNGWVWKNPRRPVSAIQTHTIEVNVHELRELHGTPELTPEVYADGSEEIPVKEVKFSCDV